MRRCLALLIGVGGLLVASVASAQTSIYACVKQNNGQARIVSATEPCGPSEAKVTWGIVGPQGPAGPKGDPGELGSGGGIRIVDARNKYIGNFAGGSWNASDWSSLVTRQENGFTFLLTVGNGGLGGPMPTAGIYYPIVYLDSSCAGPQYIAVNPNVGVAWGTPRYESGGWRVYYPVQSPHIESFVYIWWQQGGTDFSVFPPAPYPIVCGLMSQYGSYAQAEVVNLGPLTEPFRFGQ